MTEPKLTRALDGDVAPMWWDGDVILADRTEAGDGLMTIEPGERGLYVVVGRIWTWEEVPVDAADTVHGVTVRP